MWCVIWSRLNLGEKFKSCVKLFTFHSAPQETIACPYHWKKIERMNWCNPHVQGYRIFSILEICIINDTLFSPYAPESAITNQYFLVILQYSQTILTRRSFKRSIPAITALPNSMIVMMITGMKRDSRSSVAWKVQ